MFIKKLIKKQIVIGVITAIMLTLVAFTSAYALFEKSFESPDTQTLSVGDLIVSFSNSEGDELDAEDAINLSNMSPMSDEEGEALSNNLYTFVINNTGSVAYSYTISLEDNEEYNSNILLPHNYIRYQLNSNSAETLGDKTNDIIYTYTINPGETHEYTLRLWVAEAEKYNLPNSVLGKEVHLNIIIDGEATDERAPEGWYTAETGTLLAGIKNNYPKATSPLTTPGVEVSTSEEKVLASTSDDYGTSYYFRGNVQNNYVVFNNMCWRIVRITGDGSIKLILQNERGTSCEVTDYNYNYARYDGTNTTSAFNETSGVYDTATGVGFMYGNPTPTGSTDNEKYLEAQANTTDSTILTRLKSWYDRVFTTEEIQNMLADTIWCGDKSLNSGVGYGSTYSNYRAYKRIYNGGTLASNIAGRNPSLICPSITGAEKLSKYTAQDTTNGNGLLKTEDNGTTKYYKIGLLTADEAAFAGGVYNVENKNYYLYNGHYYWLLSPFDFVTTDVRAVVWFVYSAGDLSGDVVTGGLGVRPAVSLKSTASVSGGDGTINNPYIIG